jgi:hypothetical protein
MSWKKWPLMIALLVAAGFAQNKVMLPAEPDAMNVFFHLDASKETLRRLPSETWKRHTGSGFASVTYSLKLDGAASSYRISQDDKMVFVFRPLEKLSENQPKLFRCTVKGEGREVETGKYKHRDFVPNQGLTLAITKFGDSSYQFTPEAALEPGEYVLTTSDHVYSFGVDAKK